MFEIYVKSVLIENVIQFHCGFARTLESKCIRISPTDGSKPRVSETNWCIMRRLMCALHRSLMLPSNQDEDQLSGEGGWKEWLSDVTDERTLFLRPVSRFVLTLSNMGGSLSTLKKKPLGALHSLHFIF